MAPLRRGPADPVVRFETAPGEQMQADLTTVRRGRLLVHERQHLQPLPGAVMTRVLPPPPVARVLRFPSTRHRLSVYGELMEAMA